MSVGTAARTLRGIGIWLDPYHRGGNSVQSPIRFSVLSWQAIGYGSSTVVNDLESARCFSSRLAASCRSRSATILYLSKTERVLWPEIAIATRSGTPARTKFLTAL